MAEDFYFEACWTELQGDDSVRSNLLLLVTHNTVELNHAVVYLDNTNDPKLNVPLNLQNNVLSKDAGILI